MRPPAGNNAVTRDNQGPAIARHDRTDGAGSIWISREIGKFAVGTRLAGRDFTASRIDGGAETR